MKRKVVLLGIFVVTIFMLFSVSNSYALHYSGVVYGITWTGVGQGYFDYTVYHQGSPDVPPSNIIYFDLEFPWAVFGGATVTSRAVPTGWGASWTIVPITGCYHLAISTTTGPGIAPFTSLGGFQIGFSGVDMTKWNNLSNWGGLKIGQQAYETKDTVGYPRCGVTVPEPTTLLLLGSGLLGLGAFSRLRRKKK